MKNAKTITNQLWEMANKLRGTMDASEYKNYILPFMFYRYLSERQDEYLKDNSLEEFYELDEDKEAEELDEYIEDIVKSLGYAINPKHTWQSIVDKIANHKIIASDFQDLFDEFNKNVKRNESSSEDFADVFADVNLGDTRLGNTTNARAQALYDIVTMINEFNFKDDSGQDILGDVYEYLIGQFAATAGKKGGEFYTPHEVSKILAKLVTLDVKQDGRQFRVYDPTMG
ncbi:MAG: N-6 DNA methylase, partial [Epulopiscium sp.]|nr:N-6 DNA methylase [Candidatus Epulonipiscium sp.]